MVEPAAVQKPRNLEVHRYFRKWARNVVHIPAKLEVVTVDGKRFTTGSAIIRDVSLRGARLGRMVLKKGCLPARSFRIKLFFRSEKYQGIGALCKPIRFGKGPEFELAVEFEDLWARTDEK
jgi:hypothetical protein